MPNEVERSQSAEGSASVDLPVLSARFVALRDSGDLTAEFLQVADDLTELLFARWQAELAKQNFYSAGKWFEAHLSAIRDLFKVVESAQVIDADVENPESLRQRWERERQIVELHRDFAHGLALTLEGKFAPGKAHLTVLQDRIKAAGLLSDLAVMTAYTQGLLDMIDGQTAYQAKNFASARAAFERAAFKFESLAAEQQANGDSAQSTAIAMAMTVETLIAQARSLEMRFHQHMDSGDYKTAVEISGKVSERMKKALDVSASLPTVPVVMHIALRAEQSKWEAWEVHASGHQLRERTKWRDARRASWTQRIFG